MGHVRIKKTPAYTWVDWCWLLWGVSVTPKRLDYKCCKCDEVLESITDEATLKAEANH